MSRNVRQKFPRTPVKATKRRGSDTSNSSLDLSSDGGYSALDEESEDSEDDEEGVNAAEEEHMIADELRTRRRDSSSPRPDSDDDDDDADGEDDGDDDDVDLDEDDDADSGSWNGIVSEAENGVTLEHPVKPRSPTGVKRQVRFAVPDSDSDSDSTTTETSNDIDGIDEMFPDIFVAQASLDPGFRREIEQDADETSSIASYWDFQETSSPPGGGADQRALFEVLDDEASTPVPSPEDDQDVDGYDSDGDTTEEDIPEPSVRRKQLHAGRTGSGSSGSDTDRPIIIRRGRPRSGQFDLDRADQKPIAVMHPVTRKLIIFTPETASGFDLSPESFRGLEGLFHSMAPSSPITRHSNQDIMMAPMLSNSTLPDILSSSYPFGSIEAFLPSVNLTSDMEDDSDFSGETVDDGETLLNLDDFIEFEAHASAVEDEEKQAENDDESVWGEDDGEDESPTTPTRRPSTAVSASSDTQMDLHPLLTHFENNTDVGAFRRNKVNQQLILSGAATSESLAFSGPYMMGTLKGIKSDRLDTVTTSLSPVRRRKRSSVSMTDANEFRATPLETKRKASDTINGHNQHKKHRSISDVRDMAL